MDISPDNEFQKVERRIHTLTTLLQQMNQEMLPTADKKQIPPFLRHFATLLTCDAGVGGTVAVTGSMNPDGTTTALVLTHDPSRAASDVLEVEEIRKSDRAFEDVINGWAHPSSVLPYLILHRGNDLSFESYMSDLWSALAYYAIDGKDYYQFHSLCTFVTTQCFGRIASRVFQDVKVWGLDVAEVIIHCKSDPYKTFDCRWVEAPTWALQFYRGPESARMKERTVEISGRQVTQWKFSYETMHEWAQLLARVLHEVKATVEDVNTARAGSPNAQRELSALKNLSHWCFILERFVNWKDGIVETLFTQTTLVEAFWNFPLVEECIAGSGEQTLGGATDKNSDPITPQDNLDGDPSRGDEGESDGAADLREEEGVNDSEGNRIIRYLRSVVAWHAALTSFCLNDRLKTRHIMGNLVIGLVRLPSTTRDAVPFDDIREECSRRYPSSLESRGLTEFLARRGHGPSSQAVEFTGTFHAEAVLVGLLAYFSPGSTFVNHGVDIQNINFLQRVLVPATYDLNAVASSRKCCWCCHWLATHVKGMKYKFPASNGLFYAWSPPRIGIGIAVFRAMEAALWEELRTRARNVDLRQQMMESGFSPSP